MSSLKYSHSACLALAGALIAGPALAAGSEAQEHRATELAPAKTRVADQMIQVQGVQVAIDPATGRLVAPNAAQRAALSAAMMKRVANRPARTSSRSDVQRSTFGAPINEAEARKTLRTHRLRNGRTVVGIEVPESLMSSLMVERRADGSLDIHHAGDTHSSDAVEVTK